MLVSVTDTIVDKNAVVVVLRNASLANTTVLGTRWLESLTGAASVAWEEDCVVVRIE